MATFTVTYTFVANTKARAAEVNQNFTDVLTILQAHHHDPNIYTNAKPITNSGIAANAQILDTQLQSPITRSGLINKSAIQYVTADKGGTGLLSIAAGEIIYGDSANVYRTLPIGAADQFLRVSSSAKPYWADGPTAKFGGTGADGALSITSGTTTLAMSNASIFIKNYTSISITSTATLAFSDPATAGTFIFLRSQGAVTISATVDASGMGAAGGTAGGPGAAGNAGTNGDLILDDSANHNGLGGGYADAGGTGASASTVLGNKFLYTNTNQRFGRHGYFLACGSGGGGGSGTRSNGGTGTTGGSGGAGGRGGGALVIECGGAWNFTGTVTVNGSIGSNGTVGTGSETAGGGGGGGGAAGMFLAVYASLTASSGTVNTAGGTGGDGGTNNVGSSPSYGGGAGGSGGASYTGGGGAGGNGGPANTNGSAGSNGSAGAGGGGGGGGGGTSGTTRTGGAGGTSSNDSNHYLITQNYWFS